jgi:hypothetical protein
LLGAGFFAQAQLVKPILFLSKVPMVYGTVISNAIFLGAIVSVSAMLSSSGPSPSSTAPPPPGPLSIPGGAPLLQGQGAHCQLPGDPLREVNALLMGLVLHVDRGACSKACTVRCLLKKSAVYHPYFPLFITPCNELVIITKVITRPRNDYEARNALRIYLFRNEARYEARNAPVLHCRATSAVKPTMATVGDRYEPNGARERRASPLNGDHLHDMVDSVVFMVCE